MVRLLAAHVASFTLASLPSNPTNPPLTRLQVWQPSRAESFMGLNRGYARMARASLVLFDSTSSESFAYMKRIVDVISPVAGFRVIMIVATKVDLLSDRVVTQDEASDYARSLGFLYAETSAKTGEGVDNAFKTCITVALEKESSEEAPKTDVITLQENPPSVANQDCQC